jgi:DNA-binding SARP family transcriptional activator/tetratricopeptide (TPR) repeat protein
VELHIFGRVRLEMRGPVNVRGKKVRGLLGYLSYKANELVHVDRIADALWDGDAPADPGKTLQTYASRLRGVLRIADCPAELMNEHRSYRLSVDQSTVDYHRFLAGVRDGHRARARGDLLTAAELFTSALDLLTGPLLADLDTPWARLKRETMTLNELIPAHCALFDAKLAIGDHDFVLGGLPPLLSDHPNDDRLATRWIRTLVAVNRADEIPIFFREFTRRLADDLGVAPPTELVHAFRDATSKPTPPARPVRKSARPRDIPHFTGRDDLIEQLDHLLTAEDRSAGVVALDGLPGIGKTALVKHWAHLRRDRFPDGVLFADLAGYSDTPLIEPHHVLATFLVELGVDRAAIPNSTDERATCLRHMLSARTVLLILDNAKDSSHVRPLLEATSPCPAIITSRQRLSGINYRDGVQLLSVPALPPGEATALLSNRIGLRAATDPAAFVRLVELCRGLPLALRIVGEHVVMRPAAPIGELAAELRHTRRLLDAGAHGDDHTTTLRSTFSWSYRALRPEEQRLFRLLGLHPGTRFSVGAGGALAGTPADVERLLDSLVGAHLVAQERAGQYHMHDLLYGYAVDVVQEDEPTELRARATHRLFDWYLQSARHARTYLLGEDRNVPDLAPAEPVTAMDFANRDEALRWLVDERANIVACTYRAADLGYHEHVWRLAACLHVLNQHEDPRALLAIHELAQRSAELAGRPEAVGGSLINEGAIYARLNEDASAGRCFEMAYEVYAAARYERGIAITTHNMGYLKLQLGQPAEAIPWLNEALTLNLRGGSEFSITASYRCLGEAYRMLGRFTEARSHFRRSLFSSQKSDNLLGQAHSLSRLAQLALDENRLDEAINYGAAALDMFDRVYIDRVDTAATLRVLATAHLRQGTTPIAVSLAQAAVRTCQEAGNISGQIEGLILLGQAQAAAGEPAKATAIWTTAAKLITSPTDPRGGVLHTLLTEASVQPVPAPRTEDSVARHADLIPDEARDDVR